MRLDARQALEGLGPTSPYRATMMHTEGLSFLLEGDLDRADAIFAHAIDVAEDSGAAPLTALLLAERFLVAADREDWKTAHRMVERAVGIVERNHFDGYWTSALVFACAARAAAHRGDLHAARAHVRRAAALRPLLTYALPVVSAQSLLEMARAYLALVDPSGARAALQQFRQIQQQRPQLGELSAVADELGDRMSDITASRATGASSLTTAELRLLPLLPTHLTFPEIGAHLHVSRHTVKSQAMSVYRKLGVSSRSEAVSRMTELGFGS
jgi:LuxR family maltose regulon positive regulatory protein